ncbi:MAG: exodeoxyribonuclease III [Candidatus Ancaeobacter aquaticus]|nr:exodeoxyribonuclease III [Candidatus Ancaeobacter aquaticus]
MTTKKIISWNVNGIRAIYKKGLLDYINKANPDILCLQETKATASQLPKDLRNIPGYHAYFSSSEIKKGYSGVAIYSKIKPDRVLTGIGEKEYDSEGRILAVEFGDIMLCNIYFPNGKASPERLSYKMGFYDAFLSFVEKEKKKGKKVIVCGDVNTAHTEIDLARPKENQKSSGFLPQERSWIDSFIGHGYSDTLRMFHPEPELYTWWDMKSRARERNVGWRIDYFFVSDNTASDVKKAYIESDIVGSDHCPIGIDIKLNCA